MDHQVLWSGTLYLNDTIRLAQVSKTGFKNKPLLREMVFEKAFKLILASEAAQILSGHIEPPPDTASAVAATHALVSYQPG